MLLRNGARGVVAVDVGYGLLAWSLSQDPRVVVLDRTNIRDITPELVGGPVDVVVTLTGAHASSDARVLVLADGDAIAELDPPDERDRSWQSPPVRVALDREVVRFSLEMIGGAPDDVAWVRDIALFDAPR